MATLFSGNGQSAHVVTFSLSEITSEAMYDFGDEQERHRFEVGCPALNGSDRPSRSEVDSESERQRGRTE